MPPPPPRQAILLLFHPKLALYLHAVPSHIIHGPGAVAAVVSMVMHTVIKGAAT